MGVSVRASSVFAFARLGESRWTAAATYDGHDALAEVLASLAAERPAALSRVRVALECDVAQCKLVEGLPRMSRRELSEHVRLQWRRYFLLDGSPMIVDGVHHSRHPEDSVCLAAVSEALMEAICRGLEGAGLTIEAMAPAMCWLRSLADTNADVAPLERAPEFVAASLAAAGKPLLRLEPNDWSQRALRAERQRALGWAAAAAITLVIGAAIQEMRLGWLAGQAERELEALRPAAQRLHEVRATTDSLADALVILRRSLAATSQSRGLAALAAALPESSFVTAVERDRAGAVLTVFTVRSARVLAALDRDSVWRGLTVDGPIIRERLGSVEWEKLTLRTEGGAR